MIEENRMQEDEGREGGGSATDEVEEWWRKTRNRF